MKEITEAELEAKFEDYVERCEEGEVFIIKCFDGRKVAMVPADEYADVLPKTLDNDDDSCDDVWS
mgnify:FL=1|tara:strand:- start:89 stop:283 length:195 start_codon:yes stop_codon:yes gene_type:complete